MNPVAESAWIQTASGGKFHFLAPRPEEILIQDIAHALSHLCRFNGHSKFYSVAEHSVRVSWAVPPELQLKALLHDAAEAYCGDMTRPLKNLCPDYEAIEINVRDAIFKKFGLSPGVEPEIKQADRTLLVTEARDLLSSGTEDWQGCLAAWDLENCEPLRTKIRPWAASFAKGTFLGGFHALHEEGCARGCPLCKLEQ